MSKPKGGKKDASSPEEAIKRIEDVEKLLNKKTQFLEGQIKQQLKIAQANGRTNKRGNGSYW